VNTPRAAKPHAATARQARAERQQRACPQPPRAQQSARCPAAHLDLTPHVLDVFGVDQLALGDALAGGVLARDAVHHKARHAKLAAPQHLVEDVVLADVLPAAQHALAGRLAWRHGACLVLLLAHGARPLAVTRPTLPLFLALRQHLHGDGRPPRLAGILRGRGARPHAELQLPRRARRASARRLLAAPSAKPG
jgi:hypothetical protein